MLATPGRGAVKDTLPPAGCLDEWKEMRCEKLAGGSSSVTLPSGGQDEEQHPAGLLRSVDGNVRYAKEAVVD